MVCLLNILERCDEDFPLEDINLHAANELIIVAERLKMRKLVKKILQCIIFQQINRENVLYYIRMSYSMVWIKASLYRQEVAENNSDSDELSEDSSEGDEESNESD